MAHFYANENFPQPVVEELRRLGHDVLTVLETGKAGISWPDREVLEFATAQNRIVLTMNRRHFRKLHQTSQNHAGIVLCTVDLDYLGQAARIDEAVRQIGDCRGQLIAVNRPVAKPR
jgi:hypothetical protein